MIGLPTSPLVVVVLANRQAVAAFNDMSDAMRRISAAMTLNAVRQAEAKFASFTRTEAHDA